MHVKLLPSTTSSALTASLHVLRACMHECRGVCDVCCGLIYYFRTCCPHMHCTVAATAGRPGRVHARRMAARDGHALMTARLGANLASLCVCPLFIFMYLSRVFFILGQKFSAPSTCASDLLLLAADERALAVSACASMLCVARCRAVAGLGGLLCMRVSPQEYTITNQPNY